MQTLSLPSELSETVFVSRQATLKVMLDLTFYLEGPTEHEFEYLIELYSQICPPSRFLKFKIAELPMWSLIAEPALTKSGRMAAKERIRSPFFEPSRERIRQGRAFEAQIWDGNEIDDPDGSWSFNCQRIHKRAAGHSAFARILVPVESNFAALQKLAIAIADNIQFYSGHGGLVFAYNPSTVVDSFDGIYARSRRFWGVDVECMNLTLPLLKQTRIKGVNWLTLVGNSLTLDMKEVLAGIEKAPGVTLDRRKFATVLTAGPQPVVGDQHRPDETLAPYYSVATALRPIFLQAHPDFPSERFVKNGNTVGWIRRFIEPEGWR